VNAEARLMELTRILSVLPTNLHLSTGYGNIDFLYRNLSDEIGVPMFRVMQQPMDGWEAVAKRAVDLVLGGLILIAAAPFLLLIALAVKLDSPGPALFRQTGFNNHAFDMFKFRTMYSAVRDHRNHSRSKTTRAVAVGALRRFGLVASQLFNVLRGNMSLVRPSRVVGQSGGTSYEKS
jgi:lipopolysaccharide/colanic/teichoic acid biosynthesis glycosyltransferase